MWVHFASEQLFDFHRTLFVSEDAYFSYGIRICNLKDCQTLGFYSKSVTEPLVALQLRFCILKRKVPCVVSNDAPATWEISSSRKKQLKSGKKHGSRLSLIISKSICRF